MIKGIIALTALATLAMPVFASAASYAYVNNAGNVATVEASTPDLAILNAPGISLHSGVILLSSLLDSIVGDHAGI